jgi:hypothetical protein
MKKSTLYILFFLLAILVTILIVSLIQSFKKQPSQTPAAAIKITQFSPNQGSIYVSDPLTITFDKPVDPEDLQITINPPAMITTSLDPAKTLLTIQNQTTWTFNTEYTLTITNKDNSTEELDKVYQFQFKTSPFQGM